MGLSFCRSARHPDSEPSRAESLSAGKLELSEPLLSKCKGCFALIAERSQSTETCKWTDFKDFFVFDDRLIIAIKVLVHASPEDVDMSWNQFEQLYHSFCSSSSTLEKRAHAYLRMFVHTQAGLLSHEETQSQLLQALLCALSLALRLPSSESVIERLKSEAHQDAETVFKAWISSGPQSVPFLQWSTEYARAIGEPLSQWLEWKLHSAAEAPASSSSAPASPKRADSHDGIASIRYEPLPALPALTGRHSTILSAACLFMLYNTMDSHHLSSPTNKVLYSSSEDGQSMTSLSPLLLGYKAASLLLVETESDAIWAVWVGCEYQDSLQPSGSTNCSIMRVLPSPKCMKSLEKHGQHGRLVYFNTHEPKKGAVQSSPKGMGFGSAPADLRFFINGDLNHLTVTQRDHCFEPDSDGSHLDHNVFDAPIRKIEVWGLGNDKVEQGQREYRRSIDKMRENHRMVDRGLFHQGLNSWKENPDKAILDLMGKPSYSDALGPEEKWDAEAAKQLPGVKGSSNAEAGSNHV